MNLTVGKLFGWLLATLLLTSLSLAGAQQQGKVYRIGYLSNASRIGPAQEQYQQALREVGYVEGDNVVTEWRFSNGRVDRFPDLAAELVRLKVDCIVTIGVLATRAAKEATRTIPIIMGNSDDDPVRQGLVPSFSRPGGNVTGFTNIGSDLAGKRLELLKETFPKVSRVAILFDPASPPAAAMRRETGIAARALGIELQPMAVQGSKGLEQAFQNAAREHTGAIIVVHTGGMNPHRVRVRTVKLAQEVRLPAMYTSSIWVDTGGLMSYDADEVERYRGIASYVDKIFKGTNPGSLPVQRPTKFKFIINLKTAKQIAVTIPPNVLARADKVLR
jgi:ABC-type uncharacterized transport system substrate-binding protein